MLKVINDKIYCEKAASKFFRSKVIGKYEQYEDFMQDYRIKVWQNRDKIAAQPHAINNCKQQIMSSIWKDYLRAISKDKVTKELLECNFIPSTDEVSGESYYDFLESKVEAQQSKDERLSEELLALLPDDQAAIIKLRYEEDITFEEIAERLKIPKPTAYFRHQRGIKALQKKYTLQEILELV
jgi:RNA polymerase sigma factor (sigma-70 family)